MNKTPLRGLLSRNINSEYSQAALNLMEGMPSRNPNKPTIPVNPKEFRRQQKTNAINEEINYIKRRQNIQILLRHFNHDLYHTVQSVMIKPENGGIYYGDELINHFIINKINSNYKAVNNNTISEFINDYTNIILSQVDSILKNYNTLKELIGISDNSNLTNEEITENIIRYISTIELVDQSEVTSKVFKLLKNMGFSDYYIELLKSSITRANVMINNIINSNRNRSS
jgi:hypothetical protein